MRSTEEEAAGASVVRVGPGAMPLQASSPNAVASPPPRRRLWVFILTAVVFFAVIGVIIGVTVSQGDEEDPEPSSDALATTEAQLMVDGITLEQIQRVEVRQSVEAAVASSFASESDVTAEVRA